MTGRASTLSPESLDYLPGSTAAEKRSLAKWYAAARAALARNRPLTTAATSTSDRRRETLFQQRHVLRLTSDERVIGRLDGRCVFEGADAAQSRGLRSREITGAAAV